MYILGLWKRKVFSPFLLTLWLSFACLGLRSQPHPPLCHLASIRSQVPQDVSDYSLWLKAGEHLTKGVEQVRYQNNRLWKLNFLRRARLHLHLVEVLSGARDHARHPLRHSYRYVVLWLHHGLALHRLPNFPRWQRERPDVTLDGDGWHPRSKRLIYV